MDKKVEKYVIIGAAVIFGLLILILLGVGIYFIFFRNSGISDVFSTPTLQILRVVDGKQYLTSQDLAEADGFYSTLSSDHTKRNAIKSPNGKFFLTVDSNCNVRILKLADDAEHGDYTIHKELYKNKSPALVAPFSISVLSKHGSSPATFETSTVPVIKLFSDSDASSPTLVATSKPNTKTIENTTNNYAVYVTDEGKCRLRIFSQATFDPTVSDSSTNDFEITSFGT